MANMITDSLAASTTRKQIGEYRLLEQVGTGRSGGVFSAESPHSRRPVAIKLLGRIDNFLKQAQLLSAIEHDHLVSVLDAGQEKEECFLVMELLNGETLQARLKREHRLPVKEAMRIGRETASGLAFAHAHGLIHRDVCPANVWLEPGGRVRLLGLGSAHDEDSLLGRLGGPGTPGYLSPEQAAGEPMGAASDLFSLGCVLYQMTTGERPFRGDDRQALNRAVVFDEPPPPRSINPEIPEPFDALIMRMLAKLPSGRPESAQEVEHRLLEWIDPSAPKPILLPPKLPEPVIYPASKRILEALNAAKNAPVELPAAGRSAAVPITATPPKSNRRNWLPDLVAAILLAAGAFGLYLWWRASNDVQQLPPAVNTQNHDK